MNVQNLEIKMYKNYKELCNVLQEDIKGGKSKILQLKDWERYFTWDKEGNKFIVIEIYDEPKPKIDLTGTNPNSHNNKKVEYTGLDVLLKSIINQAIDKNRNKNPFTIYEKQIAKECGFITSKTSFLAQNNEIYISDLLRKGYSSTQINHINYRYNNIKNTIVNNMLKLNSNKIKIEYGYVITTKNYNICIANKKETQIIKDINTQVFEVLSFKLKRDIKLLSDLKNEDEFKKFNELQLCRLQDEINDDIIFCNTSFLINAKEKFEDIDNAAVEEIKINLKEKYISNTIKQEVKVLEKVKEEYNKQLKKINEYAFLGSSIMLPTMKDWEDRILEKDYIEQYTKLVNYLLE